MFDPAARDVATAEEASMVVWFDAYTQNIDRTPRNANLLVWHRKLYPIDHGAALFFHHDWATREKKIGSPFAEIKDHILLPWAKEIAKAAAMAHEKLTEPVLRGIVEMVPEAWLEAVPGDVSAVERRAGYLDFFVRRLEASGVFEEEAIGAHSRLV
jgi:hypothetical protein